MLIFLLHKHTAAIHFHCIWRNKVGALSACAKKPQRKTNILKIKWHPIQLKRRTFRWRIIISPVFDTCVFVRLIMCMLYGKSSTISNWISRKWKFPSPFLLLCLSVSFLFAKITDRDTRHKRFY